uniref:Uncharacterized protein n=1 Tax=Strigamia maritima TaxID=126957 RepID=T1IT73_STRMM
MARNGVMAPATSCMVTFSTIMLRLFFGLSLLLLISIAHGEEIDTGNYRAISQEVVGIIIIIRDAWISVVNTITSAVITILQGKF